MLGGEEKEREKEEKEEGRKEKEEKEKVARCELPPILFSFF